MRKLTLIHQGKQNTIIYYMFGGSLKLIITKIIKKSQNPYYHNLR